LSVTPFLAPFFDPRSIAVIGASRNPAKVGGSVLANLTSAGFGGRIVVVNARADSVQGLPAVASILAVDEPVDLAVIAVPAPDVLATLKECVAKGVGGAVVISAGFRETDEEGRASESELRAWLRDQPIRVLGPNCLGWIREAGIPCYTFPERAVTALAGMTLLAERRDHSAPSAPAGPPPGEAVRALAALRHAGVARLGLLDLQPLLAAYGIRVATGRLATTPESAATLAEEIGFPLALKLVSPGITHKSEVGGVRLGLSSPREVSEAMKTMLARVRAEHPQARVEGVLLQPMVKPGKELLLGALQDAQFGPMIVVGFGGIYVEVLNDTAARLAPVTPSEALAMLDELRMAPVLRGVRGEPPVDCAALADTIARFSRLAADVPDLLEVELNPLVVGPDGAIAVDARATLASGAAS
jgi:acyl-CoA synthetase (NDP forming)